MPILECKCRSCGKGFEYLSHGAADAPECPACRGREVERLLSSFAVSAGGGERMEMPECSGNPGSCGRCSGMADA